MRVYKLLAWVLLIAVSLALAIYSAYIYSLPTETAIPLRFNIGNHPPYGFPALNITIQGKALPVVLDTGISKYGLILTQESANELDLLYTGSQVNFGTAKNPIIAKEFMVSELTIGDFSVTNVFGLVVPKLVLKNVLPMQIHEYPAGLLGLGLLSRFNVVLDYPNSMMTLVMPGHASENYNVKSWIAVPFSENLITKLLINKKPVTLNWDTSSLPSTIKPSAAAKFDTDFIETGYGAPPNKTYEIPCIKCKSFKSLTKAALPNTWFFIVQSRGKLPFDGSVGDNFYKNNLVYFDFDNHQIYIKAFKK